MDHPAIPAAIVVYCEVGLMVVLVTLFVWHKKAETPRAIHAVFFPVHALTGRFYRIVPLVDYVWDHWRFNPESIGRYFSMGAYCLVSIVCWPLRLLWFVFWGAITLLGALVGLALWFVCLYSLGLFIEFERVLKP